MCYNLKKTFTLRSTSAVCNERHQVGDSKSTHRKITGRMTSMNLPSLFRGTGDSRPVSN